MESLKPLKEMGRGQRTKQAAGEPEALGAEHRQGLHTFSPEQTEGQKQKNTHQAL